MNALWISTLVLCINVISSTYVFQSPLMIPPPLVYIHTNRVQSYPVYVVLPKRVSAPCVDVHGQYIHYGGLYFDGFYWKICGMNQKVKPGYGILEKKWEMVFRMLDSNKDNLLSGEDAVMMTDMFADYFGLTGKMMDPVRRSVSLIWRLLLLHKSASENKSPSMTEVEFIRHMWSSYTLRRKMLFTTIMKITDLLLFITDNNKDGYISFPEWNGLFNVLGCNDQRAAHFLFHFTGPNFWGYSTILGARQFIMNLVFDQDPHYFFKFRNILEPTGLVSGSQQPTFKPTKKPVIKPDVKPLIKPGIEPAMRHIIKPVMSTVIKPSVSPGINPVLKPVMKANIAVKKGDNGINGNGATP